MAQLVGRLVLVLIIVLVLHAASLRRTTPTLAVEHAHETPPLPPA